MEVEAVLCEAVRSWVTSDWFCCPHFQESVNCSYRKNKKCARKLWPLAKRRPFQPACIGTLGSQPDIVCDPCPWFGECVEETIK